MNNLTTRIAVNQLLGSATTLPAVVFCMTIAFTMCMLGCKSAAPTGTPIDPRPLGTVVDEANQVQERNAEQAKFIVYVHEFDLNEPKKRIHNPWSDEPERLAQASGELLAGKQAKLDELQPQGFRLNDYGLDHVRQIANALQDNQSGMQLVQIERSESSKRWGTLHHYPVHLNDRLDEARRRVVVQALLSLGINDANDLVQVAPAFPEGLHSVEAVQAYYQTRFGPANGQNGGSGGF